MAKRAATSVLDALLDKISTATLMIVCSAEPTTRTQAVTTYALADVTMSGADFTKAAGDTSGRKVTTAQKSSVQVDATGTATHVALVDATEVLYVTTLTVNQPLISGNTLTVPSWKVEVASPS